MKSEELKLKTDIVISDDEIKSLKSVSYNANDLPQLILNISESDPLTKLKGLYGLNSLLFSECNKEKPIQIYNGDINVIFDILENYPEEFKIQCFKCLDLIESINIDIENDLKIEPSEKTFAIMIYILENNEKFKLDLLVEDLEYMKILTRKDNFIEKLGGNNLYKNIKNILIKNFSTERKLVDPCLILLSSIIKAKNGFVENENIIEIIQHLDSIFEFYKTDSDIKTDILNVIYEITEKNFESPEPEQRLIMDKIIKMNLIPELIDKIDKLDINKEKLQLKSSLRILGNIISMPEGYYTDKILEYNFLDKLKIMMEKKHSFETRKEASWIISNIAAGTPEQLLKLYENNFPYILLDAITNEGENKVKEHCLWALYNFSNINNLEYLDNLVEKRFIDIIIERLKIDNGDILCCSLEALNKILDVGKKKDPACFNIIETKLNEYDLLNDLKNLLKGCEEEMLRNKIEVILTNYYGIQDIQNFLNSENAQNV